MNRLVDYDEYRKRYTRRGRFYSPMGSFYLDLLTKSGEKVFNAAVEFAGRKPRFRGVSERGIYLKYLIKSKDMADRLQILRDNLEDQGFEVELENLRGALNSKPVWYVKLTIS